TLIATRNVLAFWDLATGKEVHVPEGHREEVLGLQFSPDGKTLVSLGAPFSLCVWDVAGRKPLWPIRGPGAVAANEWRLAPAGKRLAGLGPEGCGVHDLATGRAVRRVTADPADYWPLMALDPRAQAVAVPGKEVGLRIADLDTGKERWANREVPAA